MRYYKASIALTLLAGIIVIIAAQFSIPTLFGADGYLHIRMSQFIRQHGLSSNFHWARYSVFAHNFADKDFFYHVLLIPFTFLPDIFAGAKGSACLFAIFLYEVFYWILKRYCETKFLIPAFLLMFLCSAPFLQAISQPRNMVLIIALTFLFVHFLLEKRYWQIFTISIIFALSHVSGPYLLIFALLAEGCRFLHERRWEWKTLCAVLLGLIVGFAIHPYPLNNLKIFYLNGILVPIFALKWGLELGAEFFPTDTREFALGYPFILIGLVLLIAVSFSQTRKIKLSTQVWMSVTAFFFVFLFFSQRYITHGYPLILVSLATYFSDWWQSGERLPLLKQNKNLRRAVIAGACFIFALIGMHTYKEFRKRATGEFLYNQHFEAVGQWMAQNIPEGEVIFHSNWSDSQYLIGLNPKNDYFVTLDPIYMYKWDPKKYNLYRSIAFGNTADPYALLSDEFDCRYGYAGKNYFSGLIAQVRQDKRFEVLAEDSLGIIFRLR